MKLSVVVLTFNEEKILRGCLESIEWADEIIVVDSGSTDKTIGIASKFTKKIFQRKLDSFAKQRNFGLKKTTGDWIFYIDADERIDRDLRLETGRQIQREEYAAFKVPRRNYFFGKQVRHGGYWPDYVTRLFKKKNLISWYGEIHESPEIKGEIGTLKNPLTHCSHRDLTSSLTKSTRWTKMEAELFYKAGHPKVSWWRLFRVFLTEFAKRYIKLQGFRDGLVGFFEAWFQGFNRILVYVYLWEMQCFLRHPEQGSKARLSK